MLEDKIGKFGLQDHFKITDAEITGPYDSLLSFKGLRNHTAASIKSLEGYTGAWVEEAQTISQRSLDILTPTIRNPGSEMWFSWNVNEPTDPIDRFFDDNKNDQDFICIHVNYYHNPWFPPELRRDMLRDRLRDSDKYEHVWLGKYQKNSESRVFRNWKSLPFQTPIDAMFYHGADWGFSIDPTVLIRCFLGHLEGDRAVHNPQGAVLFVDREVYQIGCEINNTPGLFDRLVPEEHGAARSWVIRADSARPETIAYMRSHGYPRMVSAVKGAKSVMEGIEFLKNYDIVVHPRCRYTADELLAYSYKTDPNTGDVTNILADRKNHVIDALRYAVEEVRRARTTDHKFFGPTVIDLAQFREKGYG